jgi:hypothetical protein
LLLLALAYTLVNAVKPLTIDDTAYHLYAAQIANRPLDPYGFSAYWWNYPEVANEVLAPPLLAYWWAPAIRLFGDQPFLWKLWLFPFAVLLAYAVCDLARRFARGVELPITALLLFSPAFLPTFNLMLDVPAQALALASLTIFCRACDRESFALAALAGLIAGLGMEMKYTVLLAPAAMLLYALCLGRLRFWPAAAVIAAQGFLTWEFLMSLLYGESHFLLHVRERADEVRETGKLLDSLLTNLGGVAWPVTLLALAALGVRWRGLLVAGAAGLLAYFGVAALDGDLAVSAKIFPHSHHPLPFEQLMFGTLGVLGLIVGLGLLWRLGPRIAALDRWSGSLVRAKDAGLSSLRDLAPPRSIRVTGFLLAWLALDVVGYLALTPFPAVRRVLGLMVVMALMAGRLAALTCRSPGARRGLYAIAAYSALLGLVVDGVDVLDARAEKVAVEEAARLIRERGDGGTVWFVGHWGFQYYAGREGMRPIVVYDPPDDPIPVPPRSLLREGDWLVLPEWRFDDEGFVAGVCPQRYTPDPERTRPEFNVVIEDRVPLQTIMVFHCGRTPLRHQEGPRLQVQVRRVLADHFASP